MGTKRVSFFRSLFAREESKPERSSRRLARFEALESRELLSTSAYEAYAWTVVNEMRADPPAFADTLESIYRNNFSSAHGYSSSDPVWDDLRENINDGTTSHFWAALDLMRDQPRLGPLAWSSRLEGISDDHNDWMEDHAYAHSYFEGSSKYPTAGNPFPSSWGDLAGINGDYDVVNSTVLGSDFMTSWGENIGWSTGASYSSNAFGSSSQAYRQRAAYLSTVGFMIEVNSSSLGHLRNLLSRDTTLGNTFGLSSAKNKEIGVKNAIGIDFNWHGSGFLVTHTLSRHVYDDSNGGNGGYVVGLIYSDTNGNGYYDVGEGRDDEWGTLWEPYFNGGVYGQDASTTYGTAEGIIGHYGYNGRVEITGEGTYSNGKRATDYVMNNNVWVPFIASGSGFGLVDPGSGTSLQADLFEPNEDKDSAYYLGTVSPTSPFDDLGATLSIHSADDEDWFRFDVEGASADLEASVLFDHDDGDVDVRLFAEESDGSLREIDYSASTDDNESLETALDPGTYYLRIYGFAGDTNVCGVTLDVGTGLITDPLVFVEGRGLYEAWNGFGVNFRGHNEKYFADAQGTWYAILPSGNIHVAPWTFTDDTLVAAVDSMYWQDPNKLFGAANPEALNAYQFAHERNLVERWVGWGINHRGHNEKYFYSDAQSRWYAILPNGEVHNGLAGWVFDSSSLVTTTSEDYWQDPNRLIYAANPNGLKMYQFSNGQGLYQAWTDWRYDERGYQEKYFRNKHGTVFAILPSGQIHLEASMFGDASFYAALANDYYFDPTLLFVYQ